MAIDYHALFLDRESAEPLHLQLERRLCRQIKNSAPVKLMSERKLAALLGLDRSTVHHAYENLLTQGVIVRSSARSLETVSGRPVRMRLPFVNIGVVIPERFSDFVSSQMPMFYLNGIFDRTSELNYSTMLLNLPAPGADTSEIAEYIKDLAGKVSGVIHLGDRSVKHDPPLQRLFECRAIPQVVISGRTHYDHIGMVGGDVSTSAVTLCEQLRELRHSKVGMVAWPGYTNMDSSRLIRYDVIDRFSRMREIFLEYGMKCNTEWQITDFTGVEDLTAKLGLLLEAGDMPTIFWCTNDVWALHTVRALQKIGLRVPQDVSVVGFDGGTSDELTTIKLPFYTIGCRAVDMLAAQETENRSVKVATSLLLRETLTYARPESFGLGC